MKIILQKLNHKNTELQGKIQKGNSLVKWQNQKLKHIKRMDNKCHIPDMVQALSHVDNGVLNLVLEVAKLLTCIL